jgi:2-polyprenyl-6-methoxyphenol hydroxylase-like FAD-dependent oxidoreductase
VLAGGSTLEAALVVGADGLHSRVRAGLGEDAIRPTGQRCYRGVAELEVECPDELAEVQGPGLRFGLCPLGPRRSAWWAVEPAEGDVPQAERKARVLEAFARFPARVTRLVEATDEGAILLNPLVDRAPRRGWSRGGVVVVGDAAHPTTPNLGQGANMAIDDGLVLARALRDAPTVEAGLAAYEAARYARTARIVEQSRRFGELGDWSSPFGVWLRELSLTLAPRALLERQLRSQALESVGDL